MKKRIPINTLRKYSQAIKSKAYKHLRTRGERAKDLFEKIGLPRSLIIQKNVCPNSEWRRMMEAVSANRPIGVVGRPAKLTTTQIEDIVTKVRKRSSTSKPMTARDVTALVYSLYL